MTEVFLTLMAIFVKHPKTVKWTIHYFVDKKKYALNQSNKQCTLFADESN